MLRRATGFLELDLELPTVYPRLRFRFAPLARRLGIRGKLLACQRWIVREIFLDAFYDGEGHLVLVFRALQTLFLLRIADEGGLHQDRRNVGRLQHCEPGLLNARLVQGVDPTDLIENGTTELDAVADRGRLRQ